MTTTVDIMDTMIVTAIIVPTIMAIMTIGVITKHISITHTVDI